MNRQNSKVTGKVRTMPGKIRKSVADAHWKLYRLVHRKQLQNYYTLHDNQPAYDVAQELIKLTDVGFPPDAAVAILNAISRMIESDETVRVIRPNHR